MSLTHPQGLFHRFKEKYGIIADKDFIQAQAPGRIEILGGHTDYNEGFVISSAIDLGMTLIAQFLATRSTIHVHSMEYNSFVSFSLDVDSPTHVRKWQNYLRGIVSELRELNQINEGANMYLRSDVPSGAGLSSSAALEVVFALVCVENFQLKVNRRKIAEICRNAEHKFVGVQCGIMDQLTSLFGKKNSLLFLDCRDNSIEQLSLDTDLSFVVVESGVRRGLAKSEYNTRLRECEVAVEMIREHDFPGITKLRDIPLDSLQEIKPNLAKKLFRRVRHVVTENDRVLSAKRAILNKDFEELGNLMFKSHDSVLADYNASCEEIDRLVNIAKDVPGILGARMSGGGWGGSTINLAADENAIKRFKSALEEKFSPNVKVHVCKSADCAQVSRWHPN